MLSIGRVEAGLKSNPRCFFKFANLKRNSSDYPSAMFLGDACALNAQEIAGLFGEYFQGVYVRNSSEEDFVVDEGVEDSSTVSLIQLEEKTVETRKGPGPDGISPLVLKKILQVVKKPLVVLFT
jgi:hypothetical protein